MSLAAESESEYYDIISPIINTNNNGVVKRYALLNQQQALARLAASTTSQRAWKQVPLDERIAIVSRAVDAFIADGEAIAKELCELIGRPYKQNFNEVNGFAARARHLLSIAPSALATKQAHPNQPGFTRYIQRDPVGIVFLIAAWNYPYLITVNGLIPALVAGNAVILKQAPQTLPCADRILSALRTAGLPEGVFQVMPVSHAVASTLLQHPSIGHVQFTGSVRGGREVERTMAASSSSSFPSLGLELGGNDAAYVREDADVSAAAVNLVDGAMYNSGQSCCGIQRIYVHASVYDAFVAKATEELRAYVLGNPTVETSTLGPVVSVAAANSVRRVIQGALDKGAVQLVGEEVFPASLPGTAYVAPCLLTQVTHEMEVMSGEVFGPVAGIMKVQSDEEAILLMNASPFGLTASIWTRDVEVATRLGNALDVGTVFANRCDYLDPALPWIGMKSSGRGCALSPLGFDSVTRPKSFHLKHA